MSVEKQGEKFSFSALSLSPRLLSSFLPLRFASVFLSLFLLPRQIRSRAQQILLMGKCLCRSKRARNAGSEAREEEACGEEEEEVIENLFQDDKNSPSLSCKTWSPRPLQKYELRALGFINIVGVAPRTPLEIIFQARYFVKYVKVCFTR